MPNTPKRCLKSPGQGILREVEPPVSDQAPVRVGGYMTEITVLVLPQPKNTSCGVLNKVLILQQLA